MGFKSKKSLRPDRVVNPVTSHDSSMASSSDDPSASAPSSQERSSSREAFLDQLDTLFGSTDPDFDQFADLLHRRYKEEKAAGNEEDAETIWKVHRVPLDVAYEAFERWEELDAETKKSVVDLLRTYEQKLETLNQTQKLA